jgi:D-alanyl-lipoteichoic acid acyltransferase DltB (MBOAT superfamily)
VFRSRLYGWLAKPDSSSGWVSRRTLYEPTLRGGATPPSVLLLGDSTMTEAVDAGKLTGLLAPAPASRPVAVRDGAIPGTSMRVWPWLFAEVTPAPVRWSLVVIGLGSYDDDGEHEPFAARTQDLAFLGPLLAPRDAAELAADLPPGTARRDAWLAALCKTYAWRRDLQDLFAAPWQRYRDVRAQFGRMRWGAPYAGVDRDLVGVRVEGRTVAGVPPGDANLEAQLHAIAFPPPSRDNGAYRRRWLGRLAALATANGAHVVFLRMPSQVLPPAARRPPRETVLDELRARERVHILDRDLFAGLEGPAFFFDALHLNRRGREGFTRILGAELRRRFAWDPRFLLLIAGTTALDFWVALRIEAAPDPRRKRRWLVASLIANLGVLAVFKYTDFFIASFCALVGADAESRLLQIVLPVGISFFTFQSMSYTIDVHHGRVRARRSPVGFALFVAFFPQLVAGPIVKANEFFPDHDDWRAPRDQDLQRAAMLILTGLLQKAALADNLAPIVDGYFADPARTPGFLPAATGVLAFGLQIFFDFAGYSNIAIGAALLFGYRFPVNFRQPYLATNVAEFWRRWHVSLSTWLREYLYIPLGGNRGGTFATQRNLMLTMLLGGLWHGASWNLVVWGGLHGLWLARHRAFVALAHPRLPARLLAHPA